MRTSTTYQLRIYPHRDLVTRCEPVTEFNSRLKTITDKMLTTMYANNGIGLAANQVGILERIVVIDTGLPEEFIDSLDNWSYDAPVRGRRPMVLINPVIQELSDETNTTQEGCLSFPQLSQRVTRPVEVVVQYQDIFGNCSTDHFTGLRATCVQHEIDHLNGITLADKMSRYSRTRIKKKMRKQ